MFRSCLLYGQRIIRLNFPGNEIKIFCGIPLWVFNAASPRTTLRNSCIGEWDGAGVVYLKCGPELQGDLLDQVLLKAPYEESNDPRRKHNSDSRKEVIQKPSKRKIFRRNWARCDYGERDSSRHACMLYTCCKRMYLRMCAFNPTAGRDSKRFFFFCQTCTLGILQDWGARKFFLSLVT